MPGTLYLVSTPIGNLEDITLRALRILREEVSAIACEDTRQTQKLLTHFNVHQPLISYHEHNETSRTSDLLSLLADGKSVALVSDAGTPLVSDPGFRVVGAAIAAGAPVVPIPGASALLSALTASGLPANSFQFIGFLPPKAGARREKLKSLSAQLMTTVAYESPHRILDTLADLFEILPTHPLVVGRELTKVNEEFLRASANVIREALAARPAIRGEFTLVIGRGQAEAETGNPAAAVQQLESDGIPRMEAIKAVAKRMGLPKREVYRAVEEQGNSFVDKNRDSGRTDQ